ncbi:putative Thiol:disulfide interchange protein DsbA [Nitrospina gracilis 3/211]|uniref:Putative Thiol:disulfide interchange protein DsbA n=1 Tax=Nitrospina gracilis (strain 3/211) TaxID=1266370 RepID=M1YKF2_NITG3|nr:MULTISPECIES: DsbA family protein [Nitrospina]MCF8723849.1 thiol:disulfide interchange protein DsbA [Nitrospina sp. Nb-3]CCQ90967.1 putative Thiol:disulfide interchange protein DsbA [Nitrospina gracilis 3/211]
MKRFIPLLILVVSFIATPAMADGPNIAGHYKIIGDLKNLENIKQIEIMEFFNYSCGHCYGFLDESKRLHKQFKGQLLHKKQPIYWGQQTPYPAMAFYIADEQGMEEKFTKTLFDTNFQLGVNVFQPRVISMLSQDFGIQAAMTEGMKSPRIRNKVQKSLQLAQEFGVDETPTIIINETLKVTPSLSGGDVKKMTDNLIVIFNDILKK